MNMSRGFLAERKERHVRNWSYGKNLRQNQNVIEKTATAKANGGQMIQFENCTTLKKKALKMRFFENRTIFDISKRLNITWEEADGIIKEALLELRCFVHQGIA